MTTSQILQRPQAWLKRFGGGKLVAPLGRAISRLSPWRRRVPVLLQLNAVECGAACLAMVLSYHGRPTRVAECRESLGTAGDGASAQTIARAARGYGLRVQAYSLEPRDFRHVTLPAIVHWNFNHFVVVEGWSTSRVDIVDPSSGRRRLTGPEFDQSFTGVALTFEPGSQFRRQRATGGSPWSTYLKRMLTIAGTSGALLQVLLASLLLQGLGLIIPVFTMVVVDHILPFHITGLLTILGVGMVALVLAQLVTGYLRARLLIHLQARLDWHMMRGFFEHVLSLPYRFFQQRSSGDLLMRLGSSSVIREALTSQTVAILLDSALVVVYLAALLAIHPVFGLVVLGLGTLQVALLLATTRRMHQLTQRGLFAQAESQSYLVETLTGIGALKASGAEQKALERWSHLFARDLNLSLQRNHLSALLETSIATLRIFSPLALLWLGAVYVLDGTMSLGAMLAINALASTLLVPLSSLVTAGQQLQLVGAHLDRLSDVLEARPEQDTTVPLATPRLAGGIELDRVSFSYDVHSPAAVYDVSLRVEPGQKVALIGPSASGKSTLGKLLLGLYPATSGEVRYDGTPLEQLSLCHLRNQFGVVLQEPFLFSNSIRQNIAFHSPDLPLQEIVRAAQLAGIHEEIMQMPMGYETLVAEGGARLSGGQRQRLAIARALAQRPAVLLLDEATSHLDAVTEARVDRNLSDLQCTRVVIAHRLSTIRNADRILVLMEGRIVEQGTPQELLTQGGYYAALVQGHADPRPGEAVGNCRLEASMTDSARS